MRFIDIIVYIILAMLPAGLPAQIKPGADQPDLYYPLLKDKQVGVVANQASVVGGGSIVDVLVQHEIQVIRIFSPEHGFRLSAEAGQIIGNAVDSLTGIEVVSLYGARKKPTPGDMEHLDLILFDIQDVGVRFYTYISTLTYVMEACAEAGVPLVVLDRPNPNGFYIDGPVLEKKFSSFVGLHPVPVVYGMTIGEYAMMVNGEGWLKNGVKCNLRVIPVKNYSHQDRCGLPAKPSPNLPNADAILLYPSLCFFEGTPVSVGRGTPFPFQVYGHPELKYCKFIFTPVGIPGKSAHPPLEGERCFGEDLREYYMKNPGESGKVKLTWLLESYKAWKDKNTFFTDYFNKLAGNNILQQQITQGKSEKVIRQTWQPGVEKFKKIRKKYLLYK